MMQDQNRLHRALACAAMFTVGSTMMTNGCSPQAISALIIGLDAAADQIQNDDDDVSFEDWLHDELDDAFDD